MYRRFRAFFRDCSGVTHAERGIYLACVGVWLLIGLEGAGTISVRG